MEEHIEEWHSFKGKFTKTYETEEEEKARMEIFIANKKKIQEHNEKYEKGEVSFSMGINQFSDLTEDEFKARFNKKK